MEVLEILKERRRAICEFMLKIMNNFRLLDVMIIQFINHPVQTYFIDGNLNGIKNILKILDEG